MAKHVVLIRKIIDVSPLKFFRIEPARMVVYLL